MHAKNKVIKNKIIINIFFVHILKSFPPTWRTSKFPTDTFFTTISENRGGLR